MEFSLIEPYTNATTTKDMLK